MIISLLDVRNIGSPVSQLHETGVQKGSFGFRRISGGD